ncbi:N,N-dimethylformamidase beta subunit family domain-containing protein [Cumulibacter manganitolerans]|uniref:N,N-dimethylformamidase beta subunit family domain-containing protein n=1 Tax=Cumulibacter manganitolerans TaxID=1884992 RepID=UPI00129559E2|nr:N,N-dimethylformamidase beta subunit family domain-containing protein [Cumulibacter manganitolerans]
MTAHVLPRSSRASSQVRHLLPWLPLVLMIAMVTVAVPGTFGAQPAAAAGVCDPGGSVIACENSLPGDPPSDWQVSGSGDSTIQGFATAASASPGETVSFKISTTAKSIHLDILRMGYYQGNGARIITAGVKPSVTLPQNQPSCLTDATSGLVDCGNWAVTASWAVPTTAVSGVYLAHLVRDDTGGDSLVPFVVRNDTGTSAMLFQTSDETWQAYNTYGGNSLYQCNVACPPGSPGGYKGAYKVSYNRPLNNNDTSNGLLYAEYPMIRFLEANGYDVSYTTGLDVATRGPLLSNHKVFLSVGHDEYWSGEQRANVEAARDKGLNLAFFSGNEVFWKTRWEPSIDAAKAAGRTLVTYKETHFDAPVDPQDPPTWTGTWRDPRFSPPGDARAENSLTGQFFLVNSGTTDIQVPAQYAKLRLWRNTAVASLAAGQTLTLGSGLGTLGYEWDEAANNGSQPVGLVKLSSTTAAAEAFVDYGTSVAQGIPVTHNLTLYRATSGALVFGAGTVQWAWGLDGATTGKAPDKNMQQATVNLFADQGVQPATLIAGLTPATASADGTPPTAAITSPASGTTVADGAKVTVSGTASDSGGGVVAGVEVSTDAGKSWQPATGTTSWSYTWIAHGYPSTTVMARAVDDSGNLQTPGAGVSVTVACPCSIWGPNVTPGGVDSGDTGAVELGMQFTTEVAGTVTGVRFYKSSKNTGTHIGNLWTAGGQLLARATFSNETASGWQLVSFATPVAVTGNTTYVVSYYAPVGHYSQDAGYMYLHPSPQPDGNGSLDSPPLHALRNSQGVANDLYSYSGSTTFPVNTYHGENYYVDAVFTPGQSSAPTAPTAPSGVTATAGNASATVSWTAPPNGGSAITKYTVTPYAGTTAGTPVTVTGNPPATGTTVTGLTNGTSYTFTVTATNAVGTGPASDPSNAVTPSAPTAPAAPSGVTATAGDTSATVSWTAPPNGGSAITKYTVTPYAGTTAGTPVTVTGNPPATGTTVTGLTNGTSYTFTVTATNAVGTGPASDPSNAVVPAAAPGAPTAVVATAGVRSATVTWTAPSDGGSAITGYTITPYVGGKAQTPTTITGNPPATTATITGLKFNATYTFVVQATNAIGTGPGSAASNPVSPTQR